MPSLFVAYHIEDDMHNPYAAPAPASIVAPMVRRELGNGTLRSSISMVQSLDMLNIFPGDVNVLSMLCMDHITVFLDVVPATDVEDLINVDLVFGVEAEEKPGIT